MGPLGSFINLVQDEIDRIYKYFGEHFDEGKIPNGTKLTRVKYGYRLLYIPSEQYAPISLELSDDEAEIDEDTTHSAVFLNGRFIYLQNKKDASLQEVENISESAAAPDEIEQEEGASDCSSESLTFGNRKLIPPHAYLANGSQAQAKVKFAIDEERKLYIYKTFNLKMDPTCYLHDYEDVSQFAPEQFVSCYERKEIYKYNSEEEVQEQEGEQEDNVSFHNITEIIIVKRKQIEVQHYEGETLCAFLERREKNSPISKEEKEAIIYAILSEMQKVHEKGIVHGDLKMENICIEGTLETGFKIKFIDWGSAYFKRSPKTDYGTVGYIPPEFFKAAEIFDTLESVLNFSSTQEESHPDHRGNEGLENAEKYQKFQLFIESFKPNTERMPYLTEKVDIFALGILFFKHLELKPDSFFYSLVKRMMSVNPDARPTLAEINSCLESFQTQSLKQKREVSFSGATVEGVTFFSWAISRTESEQNLSVNSLSVLPKKPYPTV